MSPTSGGRDPRLRCQQGWPLLGAVGQSLSKPFFGLQIALFTLCLHMVFPVCIYVLIFSS